MRLRWIVILILAMPLAAQRTLPEEKCGGNTMEMRKCLDGIRAGLEHELDKTYRASMREVGGAGFEQYGALPKLQEAHKLWGEYRTVQCQAEQAIWTYGTGGPLAHLSCLIRLTRERIAYLQAVYDFGKR